jgi:hypothetical protein
VNQKGSAGIVILIWFVLAVVTIGGWVANVVKLFDSAFDPLTGEVVLRIVGVFLPPLGVVMGYL